jgi:AcrR family transcriptional regulator
VSEPIDERNAIRDQAILAAAVDLAVLHGLSGFTRAQLAERSGLSPAGVSNYGRSRITNGPQGTAGFMDRVRNDAMAQAVSEGNLQLLAVGIAARHPTALAAPSDLRIAAVAGV